MKILLASQSPRRKELLEKMGLSFDVVSIHCNEDYPTTLPIYEIAGFLSEKKASAYQHLQKDEILITADTIVCLDNQVLGKPKNKDEARSMLKKLSNNTHIVYTGITLKTLQKTITKIDKAEVSFNKINDEEIDFYIFYVNYLSKKEYENKKVLVGYNGIDGKEVTMLKFKEDINEIRDSRSILKKS